MTEKGSEGGRFRLFFSLLWTGLLVTLVLNAEGASEHMRRGLALCAATLIPSLFPFMVISDLLVRSGFCGLAQRMFERPMRRVFGISGGGAGAVILGALCGFPIGARVAVSLLDRGEITREECERLLTFSNSPSAAFSVSAVGVSLFGSSAIGVELYVLTLVLSLAVGFFFCRSERKKMRQTTARQEPDHCSLGVKDFTDAVGGAALGVVRVASFVLFFGVFLGILGDMLEGFGATQTVRALIFSVFELTGGAAEAAGADTPSAALTLAAFTLGWSGLSVHFQVMSICAGRGISFLPYIASKLIQGVAAAVYMLVRVRMFPPTVQEKAASTLVSGMPEALAFIITGIFSLSLLVAIAKKVKS